MVKFQQTAIIKAPVEKVFSLISDFKRIPEWRTEVPAISQISGPAKAGTTFLEQVNFMGTHQLEMIVIEYEPDKRLVIEARGGMSMLPTQNFSFQKNGNETKLVIDVDMRISGFMRLMEFMLPGQLEKIWAKYFENINALLSK